MARWILGIVGVLFVGLCVWTAYANVLSDDTALRARAEEVAKNALGCTGECKLVRAEGSRGVFKMAINYTFTRGKVTVTCKRPYIAFGTHACTAEKQP